MLQGSSLLLVSVITYFKTWAFSILSWKNYPSTSIVVGHGRYPIWRKSHCLSGNWPMFWFPVDGAITLALWIHLQLMKSHNVQVGAPPFLPRFCKALADDMNMDKDDLCACIFFQIARGLHGLCSPWASEWNVKPTGLFTTPVLNMKRGH